MTRGEAWLLHASATLVGASGLVYGWMRYFTEPRDPFAIVNHPLQPTLQHAHILVAPLAVFGCGMIWRNHVWGRYRSGFEPRRRSGVWLALFLLPMIVSGYLLQVSSEERWRLVWIWTHGVTSCLWLAGYLVHQFCGRSDDAPEGG